MRITTPYLSAAIDPLPPPKPYQTQAQDQDLFVDPILWHDPSIAKGLMTPVQFMNAMDGFTDQLKVLAASNSAPPESEARKLETQKVTSSTLNGVMLGANRKFHDAMRKPRGSDERGNDLIDGGFRAFLAFALAGTVIVPVVSGLVGYARGQKAVNARGMRRIYHRDLIKKNVLKPMRKMLQEEAPIPLTAEHRDKVRHFLNVCHNDPTVKPLLKPYDTKKIDAWLAEADHV